MPDAEQQQVTVVGAASYIGGPLLRRLKRHHYKIVALVRPSTDTISLGDVPDVVERGDVGDFRFVEQTSRGSIAIIDLVNQLNPPCKTLEAQLENDIPPLEACLHAGLAHDARVLYTSGNFSLPTRGRSGAIDATLAPKPAPSSAGFVPGFVQRWSTFGHVDAMEGVMVLAETKHRAEHLVHDFLQLHPRSRACCVIPAATYGPGLSGRVSFWDAVPEWYLAGFFKDFMTGFIHVEDLCTCYLAVLERGLPGGRYLAAGQPMRVSEYVAMYAAAAGVSLDGLPERDVFENAQGLVYDDSATRRELHIEWEHRVQDSLPAHMAYLRHHGKLSLGMKR